MADAPWPRWTTGGSQVTCLGVGFRTGYVHLVAESRVAGPKGVVEMLVKRGPPWVTIWVNYNISLT